MPRDLAKSTIAAAKRLTPDADGLSLKGAFGKTNSDDLFRLNFTSRSTLNLQLDSSKGSIVGVQVFSLKGARNKVMKAVGKTPLGELKPKNLRRYLQLMGTGRSVNGKDSAISLDLQPGDYYLRVRQMKGQSQYSLNVAAEPVQTAAPPNNSTPRPAPTQPITFSRRWLQQFGFSSNDYTYGTTLDAAGNLYVAGVAGAASGPAGDGFVAKYAADGTQLWRRSIDTPGTDVAFDVAVDAAGNYYVAGTTVTGSGSSSNSDAFITRYNSDGVQQWIKTVGTTVQIAGVDRNALDAGLAVALDGNQLYLSGLVGGFPLPSMGKGFLAKYDATTGEAITSFGSTGTGRAEFGAMDATAAVDLVASNGLVYATGITGAVVSLSGSSLKPVGGDAFVSAFDGNAGTALWSQTLASEGPVQDYARSIAISGTDLYITGQTSGTLPSGTLPANTSAGGRSDAFVAKYNAQTGTLQWLKQFGSNGLEEAQAIAVDSSGKIYVAGETDKALFGAAAGRTDVWLAQFDSSGTLTGSTQFGTDREDESYGVVVSSAGQVYLAGQTQSAFPGFTSAGKYDAWVAQYGVLPTV